MTRVVIVGHGSIGKRHLRIVRESLPSAEIMILRHQVASEIPEQANLVSSSITEVEDFAPQIAVIANPAPFHAKIAEILAKIGCHLLIEKPIATNLSEVKVLIECIRNKPGLICQVGYNLRFLQSLSDFRQLVYQGIVGRPMAARCEIGQYLPDWRPDSDYRLGVSARRDLGGGVLMELSHEIDYLQWLFGEVKWVSAWSGNVSDLEVDVEDSAHLTIAFKSTLENTEIIASLNMDFVRQDTTRSCTVVCSEGSLRWNGLTGSVEMFKRGEKNWTELFRKSHGCDDSYYAQFQHFLKCIDSGEQPLVDIKSGLAVLETVEAAKVSCRQRGLRQSVSSSLLSNAQ